MKKPAKKEIIGADEWRRRALYWATKTRELQREYAAAAAEADAALQKLIEAQAKLKVIAAKNTGL